MSNIYRFSPTFLYIKQHKITGKLYFGKTIKDPESYAGSGKHWLSHIKKHGKDQVETLWYCLYTNEKLIKEAAISFSKLWNIVESDDWLNLIEEDGLSGGDTSKTKKYQEYILSENKILKKHKWWNDGKQQVFSQKPPNDNFVRGRLPFNNIGAQLGANIQKEKHWITNDKNEFMVEKTLNIPMGYHKGRLKTKAFNNYNRSTKKGVKWWNNGTQEIMCFDPPDISFKLGRINPTIT